MQAGSYGHSHFHCKSLQVLCYCLPCEAGAITVGDTKECARSAGEVATSVDQLHIIVIPCFFQASVAIWPTCNAANHLLSLSVLAILAGNELRSMLLKMSFALLQGAAKYLLPIDQFCLLLLCSCIGMLQSCVCRPLPAYRSNPTFLHNSHYQQ